MKNTNRLLLLLFLLVVPVLTFVPISADAESISLQAPNSKEMILTSLKNGEANSLFDTQELNYKEASNFISEILDTHPEIMFVTNWSTSSTGNITFAYSAPSDIVKANQLAVQQEVSRVLSTIIKPNYSDFEKIKAIHDYLALHIAYDYGNFLNDTIPANSYTAYGALIKGIAVCDGYTKAAQLMLNQLGIENYYVSGTGNGGLHSWNLVVLDGQHYFMDITWDDPVPNTPNLVRYKYFLVTSDELRKDHNWEETNWPKATSSKFNYFQDFYLMRETVDSFFYSSASDQQKLYRISKDGTNKKKISEQRAPYFALHNDWIYFSNYSNGAFLYKMKLDGSEITKVGTFPVKDLSIEGNNLTFFNETSKRMETMLLEEIIEPKGKTVDRQKIWTVTFNEKIDTTNDFKQQVVVKNSNGEKIPVTFKMDSTGTKLLVNPPSNGYEKNTNYTLTVEHVKSASGKTQKSKHENYFYVQK